jgi:hypothetical protein
MGTMSPTTPAQEMAGMKAASEYCEMRSWMDAKQMRNVGQWGYSFFVTKGREPFGDGFRRMCYILSQAIR